MTLSTDPAELRRLAKFVVAGALNTCVCYALFAALIHLARWHHDAALAADYAAGIAVGFVLQRSMTFGRGGAFLGTLGRYAATYLAVFVANLLALDLLVRVLRVDPLVAQAACLAVMTVASYVLQKRWVFAVRARSPALARAPAVAGAPCTSGEVEYSV